MLNLYIGIEQEKYYEENTSLIHHAIKPFTERLRKMRIDYDDAFQVASIAFIKSYRQFDPSKFKGTVYQFSTYAVPFMQGYIRQMITREESLVRAPRRIIDNHYKILKTEMFNYPIPVISESLGISIDEVKEVILYRHNRNTTYLDTPIDMSSNRQERIITGLDLLESNSDESGNYLELLLERLPSREQDIMRMYVAGFVQREIARSQCISQAHVSRLLIKARKILKESI